MLIPETSSITFGYNAPFFVEISERNGESTFRSSSGSIGPIFLR